MDFLNLTYHAGRKFTCLGHLFIFMSHFLVFLSLCSWSHGDWEFYSGTQIQLQKMRFDIHYVNAKSQICSVFVFQFDTWQLIIDFGTDIVCFRKIQTELPQNGMKIDLLFLTTIGVAMAILDWFFLFKEDIRWYHNRNDKRSDSPLNQ